MSLFFQTNLSEIVNKSYFSWFLGGLCENVANAGYCDRPRCRSVCLSVCLVIRTCAQPCQVSRISLFQSTHASPLKFYLTLFTLLVWKHLVCGLGVEESLISK